jgi:hypothetical protein
MSTKPVTLLDEGLLNVLRAGGCECDPPGSGEQFCTGHCQLRAENERLRRALIEIVHSAGSRNYAINIARVALDKQS